MANLTSTETTIWDPAVRLFHWTLVASFLVGWISGDEWHSLHVYTGYLIGFLLAFRIAWGFVGPVYARFSNFVRRPSEVQRYLAEAIRLRAPRYLGHNPAGGAMVVALLGALALTVISGLGLYAASDFSGPLAGLVRGEFAADALEEIHEFGANSVLLLVGLHLAGVLFSSLEHGENLVRAMITGRKKASG